MLRLTYLIRDYLYSLSGTAGLSVGLIGMAGGLLLVFFGCKISKIALAVVGFFGGYVGGSFLAERFVDPSGSMFTLTPILVGLAAALLMFAVFKLALYLMGFAVGGVVGFYLTAHLFNRPIWGVVIAFVLGLIIGSIALAAEKPILILATSFLGYIVFRQGLYSVLAAGESPVAEIVSLALLIGGVVIQFLLNRNGRDEGKGERSSPARSEGGTGNGRDFSFDDSFDMDDDDFDTAD